MAKFADWLSIIEARLCHNKIHKRPKIVLLKLGHVQISILKLKREMKNLEIGKTELVITLLLITKIVKMYFAVKTPLEQLKIIKRVFFWLQSTYYL